MSFMIDPARDLEALKNSTHTSTTAGTSQCDAILSRLTRIPGEWVSMPSLVMSSGSFNVHSRIADLRKRGHLIDHKNEHQGKAVHSFYRLIP